MITRKAYEKPSVEVVELKQQQQLLVGNSGGAGVDDYTWQDEPEEARPMDLTWDMEEEE